MSYAIMFFALAPAIAPILGAWLNESYGWRSIFYFLALFSAVVTTLVLSIFYETLPTDKRQSLHPFAVFSVYLSTLKNFRFQALVLANAASFGGFFLFIASSPTILCVIWDSPLINSKICTLVQYSERKNFFIIVPSLK